MIAAAPKTPDLRELEAFELANAPMGLLRRYARGRVRALGFRLSVILIGVAMGGIFTGWHLALAMFVTMFVGELTENRILKEILHPPPHESDFSRRNRQVTFASFFQTLGIGGSIAVLGLQGESLRFAAWIFLLGAAFNSLVGARYHLASHKVRIAVYLATTVFIFIYHSMADKGNFLSVTIEGASVLLLFYMMLRLFQHVFWREEKMVDSEHRLLRQKYEKSLINVELVQSRKTLAKREQEARRLALVAEHATDSVVLSDAFSAILWVNSQFTRITGYTLAEAVGHPVGQILNGPETSPDTLARLAAACEAKKPFKDHILNYRKDGTTVWMEVSITPVFDAQGIFQMFISVERDATKNMAKQKQLENALVAAKQADTAKSEFLTRMSHELRTPINAIVGGVELFSGTEVSADQTVYLDILRQGADRMSYMVDSILGYCELSKGGYVVQAQNIDIASLLQDIVNAHRPAAQAKGLTGPVLHLPAGIGLVVFSDPFLLRHMFDALIDNAVKFTHQGGVNIVVNAHRQNEVLSLIVEVRDSGIGVLVEKQSDIFEQFTQVDGRFSRKFDGAGLGLSIARSCAEKLSGTIELESGKGKGSCFTVSLELTPVPDASDRLAANKTVKTILVAEDNRTNRLLIGRYFKDLPMHIEFAEDGVQAVDKYLEIMPDLVLMDISMPNKDGLQATREIRRFEKQQHMPACPILALTANAFASDRKNCKEAGMNDFLAKPVRKERLIEAIDNAMRQPAGVHQ